MKAEDVNNPHRDAIRDATTEVHKANDQLRAAKNDKDRKEAQEKVNKLNKKLNEVWGDGKDQ